MTSPDAVRWAGPGRVYESFPRPASAIAAQQLFLEWHSETHRFRSQDWVASLGCAESNRDGALVKIGVPTTRSMPDAPRFSRLHRHRRGVGAHWFGNGRGCASSELLATVAAPMNLLMQGSDIVGALRHQLPQRLLRGGNPLPSRPRFATFVARLVCRAAAN